MPRRATATATASRRVQCGTLAVLLLALLQAVPPLGLLLAGGPAGAAAQALPPVGPPAPLTAAPREASAPEAAGEVKKKKKLAECAIVRVLSGKTCKVKNDGNAVQVKLPAVLVLEDGAEEPAELGLKQFAKQFAATYAPGAGPTASVTFAGQPVVAAALDSMVFARRPSGTNKLKAKVAPSDRAALAALDPATDRCEVVFETPCGVVDELCTYADTTCAVNAKCPSETLVSAECADRSAFSENPCACTALQQLAALSPGILQGKSPWKNLANKAYCQVSSNPFNIRLNVDCAPVGGVNLPTVVKGIQTGLFGALPPSLGDLGPSLTELNLINTDITSIPTELGALTGLVELDMFDNAISSLPTEVGALTGLTYLDLGSNDIASVPTEIGALTSLTYLDLSFNAIASLPPELAALTGLTWLDLADNQLTGVPAEFRTVDPSNECYLFDNPGFSCANVGADTSCCTADNCPGGTSTCYSG